GRGRAARLPRLPRRGSRPTPVARSGARPRPTSAEVARRSRRPPAGPATAAGRLDPANDDDQEPDPDHDRDEPFGNRPDERRLDAPRRSAGLEVLEIGRDVIHVPVAEPGPEYRHRPRPDADRLADGRGIALAERRRRHSAADRVATAGRAMTRRAVGRVELATAGDVGP